MKRKHFSERHKMVAELFLLVIAMPLGELLVRGLHRAVEMVL